MTPTIPPSLPSRGAFSPHERFTAFCHHERTSVREGSAFRLAHNRLGNEPNPENPRRPREQNFEQSASNTLLLGP